MKKEKKKSKKKSKKKPKKKIEKKKIEKKREKKDDGQSSPGSEISAPLGFNRPSDNSGVLAPFGPLVDEVDCISGSRFLPTQLYFGKLGST